MVRHEVGVFVCTRACGARVLFEYMKDVIDNAKHNFGDPLDAKYIACARSVSENVGLLLKTSYIVSDNVDLLKFCRFLAMPLPAVDMQLQ